MSSLAVVATLRAWSAYESQLRQRPLLTKAVTASAVAALAELIAQQLRRRTTRGGDKKRDDNDDDDDDDHKDARVEAQRRKAEGRRRLRAMMLFGAIFSGPANHFWQLFLERVVFAPRVSEAKGGARHGRQLQLSERSIVGRFGDRAGHLIMTLARVAVDQATFGPFCNLVFVSFITLVLDAKGSIGSIPSRFISAQLAGWRFWPLAALVSYGAVPIRLRVLWMNFAALVWSTWLISRGGGGPPAAVANKAKKEGIASGAARTTHTDDDGGGSPTTEQSPTARGEGVGRRVG